MQINELSFKNKVTSKLFSLKSYMNKYLGRVSIPASSVLRV